MAVKKRNVIKPSKEQVQDSQRATRSDGWSNVLNGVGTKNDPRTMLKFRANTELLYPELEDLYRYSGFARRIVDLTPNLITREPWTIPSDTKNEAWKYLEKREIVKGIRRAMRFARLYGGAICVLGINDGNKLDKPLREDGAAKTIEFMRVYDRYDVLYQTDDWNQDPNSPRFGERDFYTVLPRFSLMGRAMRQFRVHHSRVIHFDGVDVTNVARTQNQGWGDAILNLVYDELRRVCDGLDSGSLILRDFMQSVITVNNLDEMIGDNAGEQRLRKRLQALDMSRHSLNMLMIATGEEYSKVASSATGVPDVIEKLMVACSAVTGIPQTILFGLSPGGLSGKGESENRMFYDDCAAYQRETYTPALRKVIDIARRCKDGPQSLPDDYEIRHTPLWQQSEKERAETRKIIADTDAVYISNGVLLPEEVSESRFGGDSYSPETKLLANHDQIVEQNAKDEAQRQADALEAKNKNANNSESAGKD